VPHVNINIFTSCDQSVLTVNTYIESSVAVFRKCNCCFSHICLT